MSGSVPTPDTGFWARVLAAFARLPAAWHEYLHPKVVSYPGVVRKPRRLTVGNLVLYAAVVVLSLFFLFPVYLIFLIAFSPVKYTLFSARPPILPPSLTLTNLQTAFNTPSFDLVPSMDLSIEIAFLVGVIAVLLGIPTAYGLSRLGPRIAYGFTTVIFIVNMIPSITIAIPITLPFIRAGLYGSPIAIALTQELLALPVTTFLLVGAFQALPRDLEAQARVDGAGRLRAIFGNLVPLVRPAIVAAFLLSWMLSWDESTFALILYNPTNPTLPVEIFLSFTGRGNPVTAVAFSFISTVPVIVLVAVLQKYLKGEDLAAGVRG